jgi:hypothetical protein
MWLFALMASVLTACVLAAFALALEAGEFAGVGVAN